MGVPLNLRSKELGCFKLEQGIVRVQDMEGSGLWLFNVRVPPKLLSHQSLRGLCALQVSVTSDVSAGIWSLKSLLPSGPS